MIKSMKNEGFSLLMIPIVLSLILAFVSLGVDFGRVIILKHQLQSIADASALAGASMIKLQFATDDHGKYDFDKLNIELIDEMAHEQSNIVYEKNLQILGIENKGVEIIQHTSEITDEEIFRVIISAKIPMFLGEKFLGTKDIESITVFADAKPRNVD